MLSKNVPVLESMAEQATGNPVYVKMKIDNIQVFKGSKYRYRGDNNVFKYFSDMES